MKIDSDRIFDYLLFHFLEVPSKTAPAADSVKSTKKKAGAAKTGKTERVIDDDGATEQIEAPPKKRKVRISVENLPRVIRTKKRAAAKARRSSIVPRRSSVTKIKSSIGPKSNSGEPISDPKPFKCVVDGCAYAGARKGHLTSHMKGHAKDKLVDCTKCEKKLKSADPVQFAKHMAEHK